MGRYPRSRDKCLHGRALSAVLLLCLPLPLMAQQPAGPVPATGEADSDFDMPEMTDWPDMDTPWPTVEEMEAGSTADGGDSAPVEMPGPEQDEERRADASPLAAEPANLEPDAPETDPVLSAQEFRSWRYKVEVEGLGDLADSGFRQRFRENSLLEQGADDAANIAQINRRLTQDARLLDQLLRAKGYYGARIRPSLRAEKIEGKDVLQARLRVNPGEPYTLRSIDLGEDISGPAPDGTAAELVREHAPEMGSSVDSDAIIAARAAMLTALRDNGYPFADVAEPQLDIDHDQRSAALAMAVRPGARLIFGEIRIEGARAPFSARHVQRLARFSPGDPFSQEKLTDLRRAIVDTGLVSSIALTPVANADGRHVDLTVRTGSAPQRTIAGEAGFGSGEGYRLEVSWQHRNFVRPEGALTVRGLLGTKEQGAEIRLRRNNFKRRDQILTGSVHAAHTEYAAYSADTAGLLVQLERISDRFFQKTWTWNFGLELLGSRERDLFAGRAVRDDRTYFIAALPSGLNYDGSNDLLDPTRGIRLGGRISPEVSTRTGQQNVYMKAQVDGSAYLPMTKDFTLAARVRAGTLIGASRDQVAPSRRFYAGGGASVRGFAFQDIGPKDANGDPEGGRSLLEFSLEGRARFGNFGVVPFIDAGNIAPGGLPELSNLRVGAGLGVRYYSSFGPIRVDVGTPLDRKKGESRIGVYVSLGQAF